VNRIRVWERGSCAPALTPTLTLTQVGIAFPLLVVLLVPLRIMLVSRVKSIRWVRNRCETLSGPLCAKAKARRVVSEHATVAKRPWVLTRGPY
jgi:hypothetical protein